MSQSYDLLWFDHCSPVAMRCKAGINSFEEYHETGAHVDSYQYKVGREDLEHPPEKRYDVLGMVGKVLFVVCAYYEDTNTVRIISARRATIREKERYIYGEDFGERY